mgnify:FL=1
MSHPIKDLIKGIPGVRRRIEKVYDRGLKAGREEEIQRISQGFFERTKNLYVGRRGFVIGNGPSLRFEDLESLKEEVTIASNKIYLAFEEVSWRPTFYSVADPLLWRKIKNEVHRFLATVVTPFYFSLPSSGLICYQFKRLNSCRKNFLEFPEQSFSDDLRIGAHSGYTVTFENLQFAFHLGLDPIYLVGCDHYYEGEHEIQPAVPISSSGENHFIKGYRQPGEIVNPAPIEIMTESYQVARSYAEKYGRRIFNATRGGHLEVFDREKLDEILPSSC